jgi:hypothetical protein
MKEDGLISNLGVYPKEYGDMWQQSINDANRMKDLMTHHLLGWHMTEVKNCPICEDWELSQED